MRSPRLKLIFFGGSFLLSQVFLIVSLSYIKPENVSFRQAVGSMATAAAPQLDQIFIFPPGNEDSQCVGPGPHSTQVVSAVVTVAFDRPDYLQRHIKSLISVHQGQHASFPLFISQDGMHPEVKRVILQHAHAKVLHYLQHIEAQPPHLSDPSNENIAYYRIANHYKFIFKTFFECFQYPRLIILEDDMDVAPDFFNYFAATAPLLDLDSSLVCISSWNDHGQSKWVYNSTQLYRSDFFPGLGWMLRADTWIQELRTKWPKAYWDDWLREAENWKGRQCIRPEVCRTYNFGEHGSSKGQYFRKYLAPIRINEKHIDWTLEDLEYILHEDTYIKDLFEQMHHARVLDDPKEVHTALISDDDDDDQERADIILYYTDETHYTKIAKSLGILPDWKAGVPRAAYRGTVILRDSSRGRRVFIAALPQ